MTDVPAPAEPSDITSDIRSPRWQDPSPRQQSEARSQWRASNASRPVASLKLGRVAMIMAICVIVFSLAMSLLLGLFGTTIYHYDNVSSTGTQVGFNAQPNAIGAGIQIFLGSVFGIWALIQGIVAAATNRGRKFGVVAIVVAGAAPILSVIVWAAIGFVAGHNVYE